MKKNLFFLMVIFSVCLISCGKSSIKQEPASIEDIPVADGVVERTARVILKNSRSSVSATVVYLADGTIITNKDVLDRYIDKKFALIGKGDTVFYNMDGKVTDVRFNKNTKNND